MSEILGAFKNYASMLGPDVAPDDEALKMKYMRNANENSDEHSK